MRRKIKQAHTQTQIHTHTGDKRAEKKKRDFCKESNNNNNNYYYRKASAFSFATYISVGYVCACTHQNFSMDDYMINSEGKIELHRDRQRK